ncbi:hypothetical protein Glove_274g9 [Diversispora epigaea]|uniref:Uncharacterized protein n=1 Tax=Diversispora epigaea TaxID=1348612 RepID=A0A397I3J9_9GLOM|nr:hypothetical protein Glove_274g9 [Diversispora epigaea]
MTNTLSTNLLRELNSKLVAEITKIRKKYSEVETEAKTGYRRERFNRNSRSENYNYWPAHHYHQFPNQKKCESTSQIENQNLIITSQKNTNILQSSVCLELSVISWPEGGSQLSTSTIEIHSDKKNSTGSMVPNQVQNVDNTPKRVVNITSATSNLSEIEQSSEPKSLEDKEIDKFLDSTYKEKVSKEIRERNRKAKLFITNDVVINSGQSHKKKMTQDIVQDVFDFITDSPKQSSGPQPQSRKIMR